MKILLVHNTYQQRGGEDSVVDSEVAMLRAVGHEVVEYRRHNDELKSMPKVAAALESVWSQRSAHAVAELLALHRPDVMHVHNTLPLVSPSVFRTASLMGVSTVLTLHNFRLMCPQAMFLRDGHLCEDCLGHVPWRAVTRRCYRDSALESGAQVLGIMVHRALGTYQRHVNRFIALSQFARSKFIEAGLPAQRVVVKPNFVEDALECVVADADARVGGLFVGRLSAEKGIDVLCDAAKLLPTGLIEVVGTGPLQATVQSSSSLVWKGHMPLFTVLECMSSKAFLLVPSICYENFPRTIAEAFSRGLPVIASRLGGMAEIIEDGLTGLLFEPGNAHDLAEKIKWAAAHPEQMAIMGMAARQRYEQSYSVEVNARYLTALYDEVVSERRCGV